MYRVLLVISSGSVRKDRRATNLVNLIYSLDCSLVNETTKVLTSFRELDVSFVLSSETSSAKDKEQI